jgi:transcriptional regulator with XRE-family HTH domain
MKKSISTREAKLVAEMLYQLRVSVGLRQSDLAKKLQVPQSFISKLESGERRIDIVELRNILKHLNTNIIEFATALEKRTNETRN